MLLQSLIKNQSIVILALVPTSQWAKVRSSGFLSRWIAVGQLLQNIIFIQYNFCFCAQCANGFFLAYKT